MEFPNVTSSDQSPVPGALEHDHVFLFILAVDNVFVPACGFVSALGCVCNPLAFAVFSRRAFCDTATSVYLRCLTLVDMGATITGPVQFFLEMAFGLDIRAHWFSCKAVKFINGLCLYVSSWTLVAVTTERLMSVVWPHRVKQWSSKTSAGLVILGLFSFFAVGSFPYLLFYEYIPIANSDVSSLYNSSSAPSPGNKYCAVVYKSKLANLIWWIFDAIFFSFLPSALIIAFNVIIVKAIVKSKKKVQNFTTDGAESKQPGLTEANVEPSQAVSPASVPASNSNAVHRKTDTKRSRKDKERSLTFTLVIVSTTFVACTFPLNAYGFGPHFQTEEGLGPVGDAISKLLILLIFTNNALNFLLYCLTGRKFRQETRSLLMDVFACGRRK